VNWLDVVRREIRRGIEAYHRRLIALVSRDGKAAARAATEVLRVFGEEFGEARGVYMYQPEYSDAQQRLGVVTGRKVPRIVLEPRPYKDTNKLLGTTQDFAVLDLYNDLKPNDVGRLGGVVRGGGIYVLMLPPLDLWRTYLTKFQTTLLVPQFGPESVRHRLKERFWRKLTSAEGAVVIDVDSGSVIWDGGSEAPRYEEPRIEVPEKSIIPRKIYRLCRTQDQVEVLRQVESMYEKPRGRKRVVVVIADRGRGKSAALGLALAGIAHRLRRAKPMVRLVVTAMEESNVETLVEFFQRGLKAMGYPKPERIEGDGYFTLKVKNIFLDYVTPYHAAARENADIVAVDEAASIPLPILYQLHERFDRLIFASTIHGYEGAGRGFSLRFLRHLREHRETDVSVVEMHTPIRYAPNDPVEKWLFDTFLLDAEPAKVEPSDLELVKRREFLYLTEEEIVNDEDRLRQFFGIYVQAHYRNEPDDLGMMLDAPHHTVRALALSNGKILVAVELAFEGALSDRDVEDSMRGIKLPGNIIPDRYLKYWRDAGFGKLAGWRIVRIATHPELQGMGLGSEMLRRLAEEAEASGMDYLGVGFGVHPRLLKFWIVNGFVPIHISPERNPVSGEYSVLLIKPISGAARRYVEKASAEFRRRLLMSLMGPYSDLEPDSARLLLEDWGIGVGISMPLSPGQLTRMVAYGWGPMTYENVSDAYFQLAVTYFASPSSERPPLPREAEYALIAKVLQARPWKSAANALGVTRNELMLLMRELGKALTHFYANVGDVPLFVIGVVEARR